MVSVCLCECVCVLLTLSTLSCLRRKENIFPRKGGSWTVRRLVAPKSSRPKTRRKVVFKKKIVGKKLKVLLIGLRYKIILKRGERNNHGLVWVVVKHGSG